MKNINVDKIRSDNKGPMSNVIMDMLAGRIELEDGLVFYGKSKR